MPQHIAPVIIDATLYILYFFSLVTWTLIFYKAWQFMKTRADNRRFDSAFWAAENLHTAQKLPVATLCGSQARVALCGFDWLQQAQQAKTKVLRFRGAQQNLLAQALRQQTQAEQHKMESGLTLLASIGTISPFVGLFGTVVGIMLALHEISEANSASLKVVAAPIGEALIATAIGIAVAVPAVLAYNFFLRQAKQHRAALEHFAESFLHIECDTMTVPQE